MEVKALLALFVQSPAMPDLPQLGPHLSVQQTVQCRHEETLEEGEAERSVW